MHHRGAHGAKHHAGEPATAMAADYHELGRFGLVKKMAGRFIEDDDAAHGHVGVPFLPPGQALGQRFLSRGRNRRPVHAGEVRP